MKSSKLMGACLIVLTLIGGVLGLSGCASAKARNTESLLSAAGFHTLTPATSQQQVCYNALPPNKVERLEKNGKPIYAYADKKAGIVYVGNESNYQRFKELGVQQKIADQQLQAAQMNQDAAMNWGYGGPDGMLW